jgi:mycothiol synthase
MTPDEWDGSLTQLRMVWPASLLSAPPTVLPPPGYSVRLCTPDDDGRHAEIMELAGWEGWAAAYGDMALQTVLPRSWFLAVHDETETPVASAMCCHNYKRTTPAWGSVGWVGCDPAHTGHGLGGTLTSAVVSRFIEIGYDKIDLHSEDFRLPALKTYLRMGFVPLLYTHDMPARWERICKAVSLPFTPERWPSDSARDPLASTTCGDGESGAKSPLPAGEG